MNNNSHILLSVHVILEHQDKVLMLHRHATGYRDGNWCLPSGRIETHEFPLQAAIREAKEEVGVTIAPKFLHMIAVKSTEDYANGIPWNQIGFFFYANQWDGELINAEPHKHDKMEFFDIKNLPNNSLPVTKKGIELYLNKENYGEMEYLHKNLTK
ncbi:MAG: NUDIX domain-containing protein [Pseudomonadota bacterium]